MIGTGVDNQPHLDEVIKSLEHEIEVDYAPPHLKRQAHPKMHGCVQAVVRVEKDLPAELRHGIFAVPGREFPAWVRFSNAIGLQHDVKFMNRGMAIKVLGVEGDRLLPGVPPFSQETDTQDFLLATYGAFVLPNTTEHDYAKCSAALREGFGSLVKLFVEQHLWRGLLALFRGGTGLARSPLAIRYFSQTPYRLGPTAIVKLRARPVIRDAQAARMPGRLSWTITTAAVNFVLIAANIKALGPLLEIVGVPGGAAAAEEFCHRRLASRNHLRETMAATLATVPAEFELGVQLQTNERDMPSDDPTKRWSERRSPFRRVATITIPRQVFWPASGMPPKILKATSHMAEVGENMSFNPWHGVRAHEPVGEINRARGRIYAAISEYRRRRNEVTPPNPTAEYHQLRDIVQHGRMEPWPETP